MKVVSKKVVNNPNYKKPIVELVVESSFGGPNIKLGFRNWDAMEDYVCRAKDKSLFSVICK